MMNSKDNDSGKLFQEFPEVSRTEWEEIITKDLKGADYNKKLIWKTNEGINVKPYYRAEDIENLEHLKTAPGQFPFVRGNKNENSWLIRQDLYVEEVAEANQKALFLIERGVDSLGFIFPDVPSVEQIQDLLKGIIIETVEINLICGSHFQEIIENFKTVLKEKKTDLSKIKGSISFNPLTEAVLTGYQVEMDEASALIKATEDLPLFKTLIVHGSIFHNAGASAVEELGFTLNMAAEYLNRLTDDGIAVEAVASKMKFEFATGSNYFMEIAKIRAARILWAKMIEAYQPKDKSTAKMFVHATTSNWNKTVYDPYVNMLRTTTEAMSSVIGGADSLTVNSFEDTYQAPTEFGERIARNQQLLLKEESYLDKVADPAAGSYYVESLTASIAEEAWKLFLATEEKDGFVQALKAGFVQETIKATAQKRDMDIANRKEIFLGTNQFANSSETSEIEFDESFFMPADFSDEEAEFESLKLYRGAQAFEAMRYKTDLFAQENKRPLAFMLTIGNLVMRKARATFASNFFACAGFEVQDNLGFKTVTEGVEAAKSADAEIVVLCSSDDEYAELTPEVKNLIDNEILVLAGYPKNIIDDLKAKGIENFIHVRSNVLESLKQFQSQLSIK